MCLTLLQESNEICNELGEEHKDCKRARFLHAACERAREGRMSDTRADDRMMVLLGLLAEAHEMLFGKLNIPPRPCGWASADLRGKIFSDEKNAIIFSNKMAEAFKEVGVKLDDVAPHVQADGSIRFNVHVDNNDTVAAIESVGFAGTTPLECQFLEYTDLNQDIEVKFQAYHPNYFLSHYNLTINRDMSRTQQSPSDWLNVNDPAGPPTTTPAAEGLTGVTVGGLLDTNNRCAFAVRLHTYPRTRNGYYLIREYKANDVGAFALVKK
jgi:hypothetical protein